MGGHVSGDYLCEFNSTHGHSAAATADRAGNYDLTVANPGGLLRSLEQYLGLPIASVHRPGRGPHSHRRGWHRRVWRRFQQHLGDRLRLVQRAAQSPTTYYSTSKIAALIPGSALTRSETAWPMCSMHEPVTLQLRSHLRPSKSRRSSQRWRLFLCLRVVPASSSPSPSTIWAPIRS